MDGFMLGSRIGRFVLLSRQRRLSLEPAPEENQEGAWYLRVALSLARVVL